MPTTSLLFLGVDSSSQLDLYSTDGTTVMKVATDTGSSAFKGDPLFYGIGGAVIGNTAYLILGDQTGNTNAIYSYNGTVAQQITSSSNYIFDNIDTYASFASGSAEPIATYNGNLIFSQAPLSSVTGGQYNKATLAIYNGTSIAQPATPNGGYDPHDFVTLNSTLYFEATDSNTNALAIYSYNGTSVTEIYNLHPTTTQDFGAGPQTYANDGAVVGPLVAFNGNLYFGSGGFNVDELNSTASMSNSKTTRTTSTSSYPFSGQPATGLTVADNKLFFFVQQDNGPNEVADVYTLDTSNNLATVSNSYSFTPAVLNGNLYFFGSNPSANYAGTFYTSSGGAASVVASTPNGGVDPLVFGTKLYYQN